MLVKCAGLLDGFQIFASGPFDVTTRGDKRRFDVWDVRGANQLGMPGDECFDFITPGRLSDGLGNIERVEVRRRDEGIDGFRTDMIGVDIKRAGPV